MITQYDGIHPLPETARGCVLVIGNFDGVHLGHRALLAQARAIAKDLSAPLGVLTFEPHPRQFFHPEAEPFRLTLPPMKRRLMEELGVNHLFVLPFDRALAQMEAEEFIDRVLVQSLQARHIVVGENFAFGRKRTGTVDMLAQAAREKKFALTAVKPVLSPQGQRYSSTLIRTLLQHGQLEEAGGLLGWDWQMEAPVVEGDKRGRTLGYPTANQNVPQYVRLPYGIYAVRVHIEGESAWRGGVANFGIRPMFRVAQPLLETFIFDFTHDIYGKNLRVQPVRHLRPEASFHDVTALMAQMKEDCISAKAVLKSVHSLLA
jgi:riboflavin kinase/FMN adenylyltransferase